MRTFLEKNIGNVIKFRVASNDVYHFLITDVDDIRVKAYVQVWTDAIGEIPRSMTACWGDVEIPFNLHGGIRDTFVPFIRDCVVEASCDGENTDFADKVHIELCMDSFDG